MNHYFTAEHNRLRHEELLREAITHAPRSGRRELADPAADAIACVDPRDLRRPR